MALSELVTMTDSAFVERERALQSDLVVRLTLGDRTAVAEAYDAHHGAVRAFAKRLVGEVAAAEDLVHEVFVSLPQAVKNYRGDASLRTFLISVAVNHARHHVRAAARRRLAMERYEREPARGSVDPEQTTGQRELARALERCLDALPLDQRVAFVLCEVEERSSTEVAEIVGAPEGTVRTRLFHAKKKLRALLEQEGVR
ncbi:MAG TPA: RNA polymerase sigma factor [Polyangiaceae bacterium]|nr:RNA polymerase sigma factor [Polyangiaceae bacterium]